MTEFRLSELNFDSKIPPTPNQSENRPEEIPSFGLSQLRKMREEDLGVRVGDRDAKDPYSIGINPELRKQWEGDEEVGFWEGAYKGVGLQWLIEDFVFGDNADEEYLRDYHEGKTGYDGAKFSEWSTLSSTTEAVKRLSSDNYLEPLLSSFDTREKAEEYADFLKRRDIQIFNAYLDKSQEEQVRGVSTRGKIGTGIGYLTPFMWEFLATHKAARAMAGQVKSGLVRKLAPGKIRKAVGAVSDITTKALTRSVLLPHHTIRKFQENTIFAQMDFTQKGYELLKEAKETPLKSFMRAWGDSVIEFGSESIGPWLSKGTGAVLSTTREVGGKIVGSKVGKMFMAPELGRALQKVYLKLNPKKTPKDFWDKAEFGNFLEELGEERIGGIMRAVTGVEDFGTGEGATTLDKIMASFPNGEEMFVEMMVIGSASGAKIGYRHLVNKVQERKAKLKIRNTFPALKDAPEEVLNQIVADLKAEAEGTKVPAEAVALPPAIEQKPTEAKAEKPEAVVEEPKGVTPEQQQIIDDRVDILADKEGELAKRITEKEKLREELIAQGKSTTKIDKELDSLDAQVDALNQEIEDLQTGKVTEVGPATRIADTPRKRLSLIGKKFKEGVKATKTEIKEVQDSLKKFIKENADKEDHGKLLDKVPYVQNRAQLEKIRPKIEASIAKMSEKRNQKRLLNKVNKTMRRAGLKKGGKYPKGKYTADIQKRLDLLTAKELPKKSKFPTGIMRLDQEQLHTLIQENVRKLREEKLSEEQRQGIIDQNRLMSVFGNYENADANRLKEIDKYLNQLIKEGKDQLAIDQKKVLQRKEELRTIGEETVPTVAATESDKVGVMERLRQRLRSFGKTFSGLPDLIEMLSYKTDSKIGESDLEKATSVVEIEQQYKGEVNKYVVRVHDEYMKAYNLKSPKEVSEKLVEDNKDLVVNQKFKDMSGQEVLVELTRAQVRKMYMESLDPDLNASMSSKKGGYVIGTKEINGLTETMKDTIFGTLTVEDKALVRAQLEMYKDLYEVVDKQYRKMYRVDLPKNEFYSPIKRALDIEDTKDTFLDEHSFRRTINPAFVRDRKANFEKIRVRSDIDVMAAYIAQAHHYALFTDKLKDIRTIFSEKLQRRIQHHFGEKMWKVIDGRIKALENQGLRDSTAIEDTMTKLRVNYTTAVLGTIPYVNFALALKQQASILAYLEDIPATDFVAGLTDFYTSPVKHWKELNELSPLFATRGENMERDLRDAAKSKEHAMFNKSKNLRDWLFLNIKFGDKAAIAAGGWAVYKSALKRGMSKADAIKEFEKVTQRTQQSSDISQQSAWQMGGGFAKLFTMFTSSQNQYLRRELAAIRNLLTGREYRSLLAEGDTKTEAATKATANFAKKIAIYHFGLPMLFQWISDFGQWEPDDEDDIIPVSDSIKRAAVLGSFNGFFILGDILEGIAYTAYNHFAEEDLDTFTYKAANTPVFELSKEVYKAAERMTRAEEDPYFQDFESGIKDLQPYAKVIGGLSGTPLKKTLDLIEGSYDIMEDDVPEGVLKWSGWSPYSVSKNLDKGKKTKKSAKKSTKKKKKKTKKKKKR